VKRSVEEVSLWYSQVVLHFPAANMRHLMVHSLHDFQGKEVFMLFFPDEKFDVASKVMSEM
jgi:hypothetical protein